MGVGKSTKGKKIASSLGETFIDLDKKIEAHEKKSIQEIFEKYGEVYFRKIESEVLLSITDDHVVIATGGGTPCYDHNMQFIKNSGISIYLKADPAFIFQRISRNPDKRPLLKGLDETQIKLFIAEKLEEREPFYLQSNLIFEIPATSSETIVKSILSAIS